MEHSTPRMMVEQYHRLIAAGILTENDPVELLEERIVFKVRESGPRHASTSMNALHMLDKALPENWYARCKGAVTCLDSEPEPDLSVVRGNPGDHGDHHPYPSEVGLVIELSQLTLFFDRETKGRVYARAWIPTYWIVNLVDNHIECYTEPTGPVSLPEYRQRRDNLPGDEIPLVLDQQTIGFIPVGDMIVRAERR